MYSMYVDQSLDQRLLKSKSSVARFLEGYAAPDNWPGDKVVGTVRCVHTS